jgi:hypothetical protein
MPASSAPRSNPPRSRTLLPLHILLTNIIYSQFTAKQLNRQAAKASKDEKTEKDKLKKVQLPSLPTARVILIQRVTAGDPTRS